MPALQVYEYAVIRVVPRVEREEFINVGVILYCKAQRFLGIRYVLDEARLTSFCPALDVAEVGVYLGSMERICGGGGGSGPIGLLDLPSRFRWLTATRSTVVQTGRVHAGLCANAADALVGLFERLAAPVVYTN